MASVFKLPDVNACVCVRGGGGEVRRNNLFLLLKWLTYGADLFLFAFCLFCFCIIPVILFYYLLVLL